MFLFKFGLFIKVFINHLFTPKLLEFGIEKSTIQVVKSGKGHLKDEMELPNQDKIRTLGEKETDKYLRILEAITSKQVEMK